MNRNVIPSICAVVGLGIGFGAGFIFAKKKYQKFYEDKVEAEILAYLKKNEKKSDKSDDEHKPTKEEAEEIAKDFPKELWTDSFKKSQEDRKKARELIRQERYEAEDDIDPAEMEHPEDDKADYSAQKEAFNERLNDYSEFAGVSKSELMQNSVNIIDAEDYYSAEHAENALEELQWSPDYEELRDVDGNILAPEITLGPDYADILKYAESMPASDVFLQDDRLGTYYILTLDSPRRIK